MIAYKVIRKYKGQYISAGSSLLPDNALCLTYKEGEITIAPQGTIGIFIFKSLKDAVYYGGKDHIFKVETLAPVKFLNKVIKDTYLLQTKYFSYKKYKNDLIPIKKLTTFYYEVPNGSFLCQKIRVLHKLTKKEIVRMVKKR